MISGNKSTNTPPHHSSYTSLETEDLDINSKQLLELYGEMVLTRILDERIWALNRQGRVPLTASCQGNESASMGLALAGLNDGNCFFFPYYRDMPLKLMVGLTPLQILMGVTGKAMDPMNGGRQFLSQGASSKLRMIQGSNVVGSNLCQATGYALGSKTLNDNAVVLVSFGDGASSQGECHEAMNFAGIHKLPIVFLCFNNRLAISVPQEKQSAIPNLADRAAGYNFPGFIVDGTDLLAVYLQTKEAIKRARSPDGGPTFLQLNVERLKPHTSDDDHSIYRSASDIEKSMLRDPLKRLQTYLYARGDLNTQLDQHLHDLATSQVNDATKQLESEPWPDPSTLMDNLYAS
mgnify:CR=1 FL=1